MNIQKILNIILALCILLMIIKFSPKRTDNMSQENKSTIETIHQRKSVRSFTSEKMSKEQLETLVRAGMAAPTAVNMQPWAFIAINDRATLDQLGEELPYAKMLKKANAAIVVCGDLQKALDGWEQIFWVQDCSAASQNILLAAESLGLGAVWTAAYPAEDRMATVSKILNLPDHIMPLNVIPVGYPDGDIEPKDKWDSENLHWNKW